MSRARPMSPADRRAAIVDATIPLLRRKGAAVSTKEIAKAAGIAEGTIFRVFRNKDELIHACMHASFEDTTLVAELAAIDRRLPLEERLTAAVARMQERLQDIFSLMLALRASGQPLRPPKGVDPDRQRREAAERLDAAFIDLIGDDAENLRIPVTDFLAHLRMLTLASVHPMLEGTGASAAELVDVILDGARRRPDAATGKAATGRAATTQKQRTTEKNRTTQKNRTTTGGKS